MGRAFGFLALVVGLWITMELYVNGIDEAFGGAFSSGESEPHAVLQTERAADAFQRSYDESIARVDRALAD